jgi:hypothetical protein
MKLFQIALGLLTVISLAAPADAQLIQDQLTRRGAVAGAVIGGIVGNQNNEAAAGIILGGLVGGVAGRAISNNQERNYYGRSQGQTYSYGANYYQQPTYYPQQQQFVPQVQYYQQPVYSPRYYGGGYGSSCGRGW